MCPPAQVRVRSTIGNDGTCLAGGYGRPLRSRGGPSCFSTECSDVSVFEKGLPMNRHRFPIVLSVSLAVSCVLTTVAERDARAQSPTIIFTAAADAVSAVKSFYAAVAWVNCTLSGYCPETDAQMAADRVINTLSQVYAQYDTDINVADLATLVDRSTRDFQDPVSMELTEEMGLVDDVEAAWNQYWVKLSNIDPTNQAEVDEAYILAPAFNILASLLDVLARTELVTHHVSMTLGILNNYRALTLATDEALVGAQSLWYPCVGSSQSTMISTVQSVSNAYPTRKLWKEFADYTVVVNQSGDQWDCDPFHRASQPNQPNCPIDCSHNLFGCYAGAAVQEAKIYNQEEPKILAKMDRDQTVITVRAAIEQLVGLSVASGSGLLWLQPGGEVDMWNVWSDTSYKSIDLAGSGAPASGWQVAGTGDFTGDGLGDILWINPTYSEVSFWVMGSGAVTGMPASWGLPSLTGMKAFVGDLNADGISDIIWTGTTTSSPPTPVEITWIMSAGSTTPVQVATRTLSGQTLQGVGDFERYVPQATAPYRVEQIWRDASGQVSVQSAGQDINSTNPATVVLGSVSSDTIIEGTGDFNGDAADDILLWSPSSGQVTVWEILGYQVVSTIVLGNVSGSSGWTIQGIADVDHDGNSDIIWQHTSGVLSIWRITSTPGVAVADFSAPMTIPTGATYVGAVSLGPKAPENIPAGPVTQGYCARNPGFTIAQTWCGGDFNGGFGTFLGDVDGDGKADLVSVGNGYIGMLPSTGTAFGGYVTAYVGAFGGGYGNMMGDVTGDGKADMVTLGSSSITVLPSTNGVFGGAQTWLNGFFYGDHGNMLGDIDGDGKADLVGLGDTYVGVLRSKGNTFGPYETGLYRPFYGDHGTFLADVDGDGRADLVALTDSGVFVARANGASPGNELFGPNELWFSSSFFGSMGTQLADVNGDGRADLVAFDNGAVHVIRSTGTSFGASETWSGNTLSGGYTTLLGDIDGNGKSDLVATSPGIVTAALSQ
jgi:hypothetical protein